MPETFDDYANGEHGTYPEYSSLASIAAEIAEWAAERAEWWERYQLANGRPLRYVAYRITQRRSGVALGRA